MRFEPGLDFVVGGPVIPTYDEFKI